MGAESQTGGERWTVLDAFGDAALVHVAAPEAELFHFAAQDGDGPLAVRHQLLQVLVAQFLAGAALARALSAPLGCVHNKKKTPPPPQNDSVSVRAHYPVCKEYGGSNL